MTVNPPNVCGMFEVGPLPSLKPTAKGSENQWNFGRLKFQFGALNAFFQRQNCCFVSGSVPGGSVGTVSKNW